MVLRWQLFIGLILLATYFSYKTVRRFHWLAFFLAAVVLISAIFVYQQPQFTIDILSLRLRLVSARSFCLVVALLFLVSSLSVKNMWRLLHFFRVVMVAESVAILTIGWGLFNARSMDAAFVAMLYPISLFLGKKPDAVRNVWEGLLRIIELILPVAAMFVNQGATAYFIAGLIILVWAWRSGHKKALVWALALPFVGYMIRQEDFLITYDRTDQWKLIMQWWVEYAPWVTGTGSGTFQWLGPSIQNTATGLFIWMHNEYLQVLFEQGILGLTLMLSLCGVCLYRAWKNPSMWLICCVVGTLFSFGVQFPLRFFVSQLFVLVLARFCLDPELQE